MLSHLRRYRLLNAFEALAKSLPEVGSANVVCTTVMHNCRLNKVLSMAQFAAKVTK